MNRWELANRDIQLNLFRDNKKTIQYDCCLDGEVLSECYSICNMTHVVNSRNVIHSKKPLTRKKMSEAQELYFYKSHVGEYWLLAIHNGEISANTVTMDMLCSAGLETDDIEKPEVEFTKHKALIKKCQCDIVGDNFGFVTKLKTGDYIMIDESYNIHQ